MVRQALITMGAAPEMRQTIAGALGDARLDAGRQLLVLQAVAEGSWKNWPPEWTEGLRTSLKHADGRVRIEAIGLARARGVTSVDEDLRRLAFSGSEPDEVRIAALSALGARQPQLDDAAFRYLLTQLGPRVDASRKLAAAQVLARARCSPQQLRELARNHLASADALVLPNLLEAYRNNRDISVGGELVNALGAIDSSLGTVGSQRVREIVGRFPQEVQRAAAPLLARIESGRRTRLDKLRRLEPALQAAGSTQRGREIFFGAKAGCSSCHTIGSDGGHVGPDLTSIGAIRSPHDLLEAIVLPSESFVPGHEVYRVETAREVYSGVLKSRNDEAVLLIAGPGDEVRVPRKEIVKMGHAPVSLMPEGFDEVLSLDEMADLLAFLRGQTSRGAAVENTSAGGGE
jgi:putative heme-binding domain-containing protein